MTTKRVRVQDLAAGDTIRTPHGTAVVLMPPTHTGPGTVEIHTATSDLHVGLPCNATVLD